MGARLVELTGLPDIDSWEINRFLEGAARLQGDAVVHLVRSRLESSARDDPEFRAIPFSWAQDLNLGLAPADLLLPFLADVESMDPSGMGLQWWAPKAFKALIGNPDAVVLEFLASWIRANPRTRTPIAAVLVQDMARGIIWEHQDWLAQLLEEADRVESYDALANSLLSGFVSGTRSGPADQPFPQDDDDIKKSESVTASLPHGSPERRFYNAVKRAAERSVDMWGSMRGMDR